MFVYLPNILTVIRICLIPFIITVILCDTPITDILGVSFFCFACITDFLDGYIARNFSSVSVFGKFLDPIADKILVISSLISLISLGRIDGYNFIPVFFILYRELLVSGLREFLLSKGKIVSVSNMSKIKTVLQFFSIIFLIVHNFYFFNLSCHLIGLTTLWLSSILSLETGFNYFKSLFFHIKYK